MCPLDSLARADPGLASAIEGERQRQENSLMLIASENHVSEGVLEAQGTVLTNRYVEGYPGNRYYGGAEYVDEIEQLAIERATELFGADHANVQPHSGTQANMAVFFAALDPGDKILSMAPSHGGHLSHGQADNFSGQLYECTHYTADPETGYVDYDDVAEKAAAVDPDLIISGSSSYPREFDFERMGTIAENVGAHHLADIAHITGLIAAGIQQNPIGHAGFVAASTHKTIRAGRGGLIMCDAEHADAVDAAVFPGTQTGSLMHNVAGKAAGFGEALTDGFEEYAKRTVENAQVLADVFADAGVSVVSGGTDKHFVLVDLRDSHPDLIGVEATTLLESVGIIANETAAPGQSTDEPKRALRIGTPAITTRGFDAETTARLGQLIIDTLDDPSGSSKRDIETEVEALCENHPVYR